MKFLKSLFQKKLSNSKEILNFSIPQKWTFQKTYKEGILSIVMKNEIFKDLAYLRLKYPISCVIAFKVTCPSENGLPDLLMEPELNLIHKKIFELFESDLQSLVTMVESAQNNRQYLLYTKDLNEFKERFEKLQSYFLNYTLALFSDMDARWDAYYAIN